MLPFFTVMSFVRISQTLLSKRSFEYAVVINALYSSRVLGMTFPTGCMSR